MHPELLAFSGGKESTAMGTPLAELARLVDGRLSGDGTIEIEEAATLARAQEGEISFLDNAEKTSPINSKSCVLHFSCHNILLPKFQVCDAVCKVKYNTKKLISLILWHVLLTP